MDAVYILGNGSLWNNEEIKFSVRSLDLYMYDLRNVYIIGENPKNLPQAIHIPFPDNQPLRSHNAYLKTLRACQAPAISDDFFLMNDDFFFLKPFFGSKFPNYILKHSGYAKNNIPFIPLHCGAVINKQTYKGLKIDLSRRGNFSPRADYICVSDKEIVEEADKIVRPTGSPYDYTRAVAGWSWFSCGNSTTVRPDFQRFLNELYPEPSKFEKPLA